MLYTVKEIAALANVTVKTIHHYHKIGLLVPCEINESGYRLYGEKELERLQHILFYRELDFPLKDIKEAMTHDVARLKVLTVQRRLFAARIQRLNRLLGTLDESIEKTEKGETVDHKDLFKGLNEKEWREAMADQSEYLQKRYGYSLPIDRQMQADELNDMASEAIRFQNALTKALCDGLSVKDERVTAILDRHVAFLNEHGYPMDAEKLYGQTRFLVEDDFHRGMMESAQVGLSYYLLAAAEVYKNGGNAHEH